MRVTLALFFVVDLSFSLSFDSVLDPHSSDPGSYSGPEHTFLIDPEPSLEQKLGFLEAIMKLLFLSVS